MQQPCDRELRHGRAVTFCNLIELAAWLGEFARCDREPRNKCETHALAVLQHLLALAVGDVVFVLHAYDVDNTARLFNLLDRNLAQTDETNLALLPQLLDRLK